MHPNLRKVLLAATMIGAAQPAFANVITDWDDKAIVVVTPMASLGNTSPYMAQRMMGMVHVAMFDAVNSIERRYRPYLLQLPADPATSKEAAAAAAAAAVLATIDEKTAGEMKVALANYLAPLPDGAVKSEQARALSFNTKVSTPQSRPRSQKQRARLPESNSSRASPKTRAESLTSQAAKGCVLTSKAVRGASMRWCCAQPNRWARPSSSQTCRWCFDRRKALFKHREVSLRLSRRAANVMASKGYVDI